MSKRELKLQSILFVFLSIGLICIDSKQNMIKNFIHKGGDALLFPFEFVIDKGQRFVNYYSNYIKQHLVLQRENEQLKEQLFVRDVSLQAMSRLELENKELKALLQSNFNKNNVLPLQVADVMQIKPRAFQQRWKLNQGSYQHLYLGQAAFDSHGILGQIITVTPFSSELLLLTDKESAIPVEHKDTGYRNLVFGTGDNLIISDIPDSFSIQKGDIFLSSGLGGIYPRGYPVAIVKKINKNNHTLTLQLESIAQLDTTRKVLLLKKGFLRNV